MLSGRNNSSTQDQGAAGGTVAEKVLAGLVLVLAQLSVFIEQTAIPRITEARNQLIILHQLFLQNILHLWLSFCYGDLILEVPCI